MNIQRSPKTPYIRAVRPMTRGDIESLRQPSARPRIAKLRDSHHIMARLFVSGLSHAEIAAETGYSIARVSLLRNSPHMVNLIERYRDDDHTEWRKHRDVTYGYIHTAGAKSWRMINDQLDEADESGEPIPLATLLKIADSSADRTGKHRKTATENVNVNFAAKLEAAFAKSKTIRYIDES
jgi:hypothetical protein